MSHTQVHERLQRHIVIVGLLIIGAGLIATSQTLHEKADQIIIWSEGLIAMEPFLGMAVFVLLAMLSAMVAFFSSAIIVPIAVYAWGKTTCLVLLWLGWLLGGIASFCIGRFLGRRVAAMLISEEKIAGWQSQVGERARFTHILLFQAVVPSEIPGYVLGILRYRFSFYLAALAITELPYVIGVVYLGDSFLKGEGTLIILLGVATVLLGAMWLRLRRQGGTG
ncbi:MAG: TVP38/TMEM64 family protein [Gammaproteobacteria bacterium]|nr:TVP38/TMEM64 family protein [Gammaproteobacteria bacterium]